MKTAKTLLSYYNQEISLNGTEIKVMLEQSIAKAEGRHV